MNRRTGFGLLWGGVTLLIAGVVGAVAYQAGLSAQLATSGAAGTYVVVPHFLGLGFGLFWLLPIFFILLLVFGAFRRGRWWYGPRGMYQGYRGVPPTFEQWHREAHGQTAGQSPSQAPSQAPAEPPADPDPWR